MRADELRFRDRPRTRVRFSGSPAGASRSRSIRENLSEPVSPGVDYRGVRVIHRLFNRLGAFPSPARSRRPGGRRGERRSAP